MIKRTERIRDMILGDGDKTSSHANFVTFTMFISVIFLLILCVFHVVTGLKSTAVIAAGSAIILFCLYYAVRFHSLIFVPKLILTLGGLVVLDVTWYFKFLSNGPILICILIFAALMLLLWEGKSLLVLLVLYFLNLLVLFYIDYNAPEVLLEYPDSKTRSIDIFSSFFIYVSLLVILLYVFKKEFIRQQQKAFQSDKLKSAFLANMSHEIRTPMNGILGFSDLLKNPNLSGTMQQEYIGIIERSGHRMLNVINNIIDISRIEAGLSQLDIQETNVNEQFDRIYKLFTPEAAAKGVNLVYNSPEAVEQIIIKTDREKIAAILTNLVKNALKYSNNGIVEMGYTVRKSHIEFYVKDNGIGIETDRQKAIFERFVQADIEDVQARQGAGLGLSISKAYAELLGGDIAVKSQVGIGSTFTFILPFNA